MQEKWVSANWIKTETSLTHFKQDIPIPRLLEVKYSNCLKKMKLIEVIQWTLLYSDFYLMAYIYKLLLLPFESIYKYMYVNIYTYIFTYKYMYVNICINICM